MTASPPGSWRLDWRDCQGRHIGDARPPTFHKRFKTEEAARRELARLSADSGAAIVGFIAAVPGKPPLAEQTDFGFPLGRWVPNDRLTASPIQTKKRPAHGAAGRVERNAHVP